MGAPIIHVGDCLTSLRAMPDQSVQTCVTSPPYFGLRDYGHEGQIGLEDTPDAFVARLVEVFREVRRVLRDDGTLWLNLGDSYASARGGTHQPAETLAGGRNGKTDDGQRVNRDRHDGYNPTRNASAIGMKHKDLIGIPWRVAFALQSDGWYLRQDIIWHKPNPMPESVTDRCTKAHEYLFLLSKSPRYYFDADAINEPVADTSAARLAQPNLKSQAGSTRVPGKTNGTMKAVGNGKTRNRRSVWTVTTKPFKGAHFATFPPDLIEPCILAGCPVGGVVLDPFGGSGTTAGVALKNGRKAVLCELNPEYAAMMPARIAAIAGETPDMFLEILE
jgi:DNA modification methylase